MSPRWPLRCSPLPLSCFRRLEPLTLFPPPLLPLPGLFSSLLHPRWLLLAARVRMRDYFLRYIRHSRYTRTLPEAGPAVPAAPRLDPSPPSPPPSTVLQPPSAAAARRLSPARPARRSHLVRPRSSTSTLTVKPSSACRPVSTSSPRWWASPSAPRAGMWCWIGS